MKTIDHDFQVKVSITVARLQDHAKTVSGIIVKEDIKDGIQLILEMYDMLISRTQNT